MITTYQELHDYLKERLFEDEESYWTYMVFCTRSGNELCFSIKEVYYSSTNGVSWSTEPDAPFTSIEEVEHKDNPEAWKKQMERDLNWMMDALDETVVDEDALDEDIDSRKSK